MDRLDWILPSAPGLVLFTALWALPLCHCVLCCPVVFVVQSLYWHTFEFSMQNRASTSFAFCCRICVLYFESNFVGAYSGRSTRYQSKKSMASASYTQNVHGIRWIECCASSLATVFIAFINIWLKLLTGLGTCGWYADEAFHSTLQALLCALLRRCWNMLLGLLPELLAA